jgi:hypothetical protein
VKLALLTLLLVARVAHADVERYAVIIGANTGAADEQRLRFAETDAARVAELLGEIGGVPDANQVVLRSRTADQVRTALITINERIRIGQRAGHDAVLFVYYSGHGDAEALHLGDTALKLRELEALVRGSSAQVRILVIDSCRSGSITRVKGGKPAPPLALPSTPVSVGESPGEGLVVLTASTAGEDAQESDQLGGSFFTHYLLSGLRGAADDNSDQTVTVAEAFAYTRDQTVLASSRTLSGTQHPTFHYDLRGRADIVLASLGAKGRGTLTFPDSATWLVARGSDVVGEIGVGSKRRTLSLRPGKYFVRGRQRDALLEGHVSVTADRETRVETASLERTEYARLVRKGHGEILRAVSGPIVGPVVQSAIIDGSSPCLGVLAGWLVVRSDLTLSPRVVACRGESSNRTLDTTSDQLGVDLRLSRSWDVGKRLALDLGIAVGGELLHQRFATRGLAPSRSSIAGHVDAGAGLSVPWSRGFVAAELAAQTHIFSVEDQGGDRELAARFAVRAMLGLGLWL